MSVKSALYVPALSADASRGPSPVVWFGQIIEDYLQDPSLGVNFFDDFGVAPDFPGGSYTGGYGWWTIFSTANGVITDAGIVGGGITLAASTTAHQGIALSSTAGSMRIVDGSGNLQPKLAFETRVAVSTGSFANSTQDSFIGLMDNGGGASQIPITNTGGSLSTTPNLIGFHKRGGTVNAADWNFVFQLAGGTAVYPVNLQNLITTVTGVAPAVGTYYKLGFVYDATPGNSTLLVSSASTGQTAGTLVQPTIRVYVNGLQAAAFLTKTNVTGATFPTGIMAPVAAFMQQSTTAGISTSIDWVRAAQSAA